MNKEYVEEFIDQIEKIMKVSGEEEYVQDEAGVYLKIPYLKNLILEARRLIKYGEYKIALENTLENLYEVSISLDKTTMVLVYQAFDTKICTYMEGLLSDLTKF